MANVDLYLDKVDLGKYCDEKCRESCGIENLEELAERIRKGELDNESCLHWTPRRLEAFRIAVSAEDIVPPVPMLDMPRPVETGMLEMNGPVKDSPVLITGNSEFTQSVMLVIVSLTTSPLRLLTVDCKGHTVDMAIIFKEFRPDVIARALVENGASPSPNTRVILPGLAESIAPDLEKEYGGPVEIGPVCAAELPLYLGDYWVPA